MPIAKKLERMKVALDEARCADGAVWLMMQSCAGTEGLHTRRSGHNDACRNSIEICQKATIVGSRSVSTAASVVKQKCLDERLGSKCRRCGR